VFSVWPSDARHPLANQQQQQRQYPPGWFELILTPPTLGWSTCKLDDVGDRLTVKDFVEDDERKRRTSQWTFFLVRWSVTESRGDGSDVGKIFSLLFLFLTSFLLIPFFCYSFHSKQKKKNFQILPTKMTKDLFLGCG
jgi:hypothetical protein